MQDLLSQKGNPAECFAELRYSKIVAFKYFQENFQTRLSLSFRRLGTELDIFSENGNSLLVRLNPQRSLASSRHFCLWYLTPSHSHIFPSFSFTSQHQRWNDECLSTSRNFSNSTNSLKRSTFGNFRYFYYEPFLNMIFI